MVLVTGFFSPPRDANTTSVRQRVRCLCRLSYLLSYKIHTNDRKKSSTVIQYLLITVQFPALDRSENFDLMRYLHWVTVCFFFEPTPDVHHTGNAPCALVPGVLPPACFCFISSYLSENWWNRPTATNMISQLFIHTLQSQLPLSSNASISWHTSQYSYCFLYRHLQMLLFFPHLSILVFI